MPEQNTFPKVSIIMPTYNRAALIMETIASIIKQTYSNWELIIIDDGSDDNTAETISAIKDERIQYYKAPKTGIGGRNKNNGLKKANGELYAFIDSDDIWANEKLERQVTALQQHPQAGFCLTGGFNFRIPYEPVEYFYREREGIKVNNVFTDYFKSKLPAFTQALMLRKECMAVTGFFKEEKSFSDLDFILTLAWHYTAVIIYKPLFYRKQINCPKQLIQFIYQFWRRLFIAQQNKYSYWLLF
jgi:glycosyltransferase involved in cell wall biosynthesis